MKKTTLTVAILSLGIFTLISCGSNEEPRAVEETETTEAVEEEVKEETREVTAESEKTSGEELFTSNACQACHQANAMLVGPSLKDIATAYDGNKDAIIAFLKEEAEPIVEPEKADQMKPQLATTKAMSDEQLNVLVDYIISHK